MPWLTVEERNDLIAAIQAAGLDAPALRPQLLHGIHPGWVGALPDMAQPIFQLTSDIDHLDAEGTIIDGTVPIRIWLRNAADLAKVAGKASAASLAKIRDRVSAATEDTPPLQAPLPTANDEIAINGGQYVDVAFLELGARRARAVARVEVPRIFGGVPDVLAGGEPNTGKGTGWLIAPGLLLTNHHVVRARARGETAPSTQDWQDQALGAVARFDYLREGAVGVPVKVAEVVASDEALDFALLRLDSIDASRAWFADAPAVAADRTANILQHPGGEPLKVVVRDNAVHKVVGSTVQYFTDTEPGSSGSPVCDDEWRIVALHRASRPVSGVVYQGKTTAHVNEGTSIVALREALLATGAWARVVAARGV